MYSTLQLGIVWSVFNCRWSFSTNDHIARNPLAGEEASYWDIGNKENLSLAGRSRFGLDAQVPSLLSSIACFVPCDH